MQVNKVISARKDYPDFWIKKWDTYFWWKFRYGWKRMSKEYPNKRQLTQNEFLISLYDLEDQVTNFEVNDQSEFDENKQSIIDEIQSLLDEQQEKLDNIPEQLQESSVLNERIEWLQEWIDELEEVCYDEEVDELQEYIEQIQNISHNL